MEDDEKDQDSTNAPPFAREHVRSLDARENPERAAWPFFFFFLLFSLVFVK